MAKATNLNQALAEFRRAGCVVVGLAGDAEATIDQLAVPAGRSPDSGAGLTAMPGRSRAG